MRLSPLFYLFIYLLIFCRTSSNSMFDGGFLLVYFHLQLSACCGFRKGGDRPMKSGVFSCRRAVQCRCSSFLAQMKLVVQAGCCSLSGFGGAPPWKVIIIFFLHIVTGLNNRNLPADNKDCCITLPSQWCGQNKLHWGWVSANDVFALLNLICWPTQSRVPFFISKSYNCLLRLMNKNNSNSYSELLYQWLFSPFVLLFKSDQAFTNTLGK